MIHLKLVNKTVSTFIKAYALMKVLFFGYYKWEQTRIFAGGVKHSLFYLFFDLIKYTAKFEWWKTLQAYLI